MAFKKAHRANNERKDYPEAYHRVKKWTYDNGRIKCQVFTYRNAAECAHNDENPDDVYGPIDQRDYSFTIVDFGGKDKLTMAETYKLLKQDADFADADDA